MAHNSKTLALSKLIPTARRTHPKFLKFSLRLSGTSQVLCWILVVVQVILHGLW